MCVTHGRNDETNATTKMRRTGTVHTDGMIDERSDEQSPTPKCVLHTDGMADKISEEGSPTPKCDVDIDRLMRGQTKDPTNINVTTNVWHIHGRNDKSNSN